MPTVKDTSIAVIDSADKGETTSRADQVGHSAVQGSVWLVARNQLRRDAKKLPGRLYEPEASIYKSSISSVSSCTTHSLYLLEFDQSERHQWRNQLVRYTANQWPVIVNQLGTLRISDLFVRIMWRGFLTTSLTADRRDSSHLKGVKRRSLSSQSGSGYHVHSNPFLPKSKVFM